MAFISQIAIAPASKIAFSYSQKKSNEVFRAKEMREKILFLLLLLSNFTSTFLSEKLK